MSSEDDGLLETLKRVAVALKETGIPFALGGGFAAYARGGPASEHDVDFMIRPDDVAAAEGAVTQAGLRAVDAPEDWLVKVYDEDRMVDLIMRMAGRPVDDAILGRAEEMEVGSVRMPVLDATDLLVGKLLSLGPHACDLARPLATARALREQVDWSAVRTRTAASAYASAFLHLVTLLAVIPPPEPAAETKGGGPELGGTAGMGGDAESETTNAPEAGTDTADAGSDKETPWTAPYPITSAVTSNSDSPKMPERPSSASR
jgi:Uncharacterised nucleotidyltransferase